ncbi:putative T7SS-secreted protein [Actinomycetospora sp. C-140]
MPPLGSGADPAALVPGDPDAVRSVASAMSRLGSALVGAGDGLGRIDTGDWQGDAADAFRRAFDPVPPQWSGTGEAFLSAADAVADFAEVLAWARSEAVGAVQDWDTAQALSAQLLGAEQVDPGEAGRIAATDRLRAARTAVAEAGDRAAPIVARARDLAPAMPSVAQQIGGFLGDLGGGAWSELATTGQLLWQVNPTRLIVEPAEAVAGWGELATGVAHAVTHPGETVEQAVNPREAATNPTRWAGGMLTGLGLSALGGAGAAGRASRAVRAAGVEPADATGPSGVPLGRYRGLTAAEHAANEGVLIGRRGSARSMKIPVREVDTVAEIDEVFRALSDGGQVVHTSDARIVVLLDDGTYMTYRPTSSTPPHDPAVDINAGRDRQVRVHTPREDG